MKYNVDYFIKKFEAIPEHLWVTNTRSQNGKRCALGWCYPTAEQAHASMLTPEDRDSPEEKALRGLVKLLNPDFGVGGINNAIYPDYQQPTPKQRILAALYDIRKMQEGQEGKVKERIVYVSVPVSITEQVKEIIEN